MAVPGLFVEYLVVGSMALIWFLPLVGVQLNQGGPIPLGKAAALAPAIYVLGMFVDFVAFWIFSGPTRRYSLKALARSFVQARTMCAGTTNKSEQLMWLHRNATDIVKEIQMRSSRDRIARGAVVNISLIYLFQYRDPIAGWEKGDALWLALWSGMVAVGLLLWIFFEANSYSFSMDARMIAAEEIEKGQSEISSNKQIQPTQ